MNSDIIREEYHSPAMEIFELESEGIMEIIDSGSISSFENGGDIGFDYNY